MSWTTAKLDELGSVGRGKSRHRPRNDPSLYGGEIPFIQTADIAAANYYIKGYSQTYNEQGLAQSKLWTEETLCITIAGENTAKTAVLNFPACFPDSIVGFVPDKEKSDLRFVKHSLDLMKAQFRSVSKGATQDNLSLGKILSFDIPIPPLPTQQRIASILAAYDDLIENNRRRMALLEQAARLLYREWFVHLRFPGHETAKIVDGLPEGWENSTVFDAVDILSGGTPKTDNADYWGDQIPFFTPKDAGEFVYVNDTEKMITEAGLKNCNSRLYEKDTLFITARGTVGKLRFAQRPMAMNQSCYALRSKCKLTQHHLYFAISDRVNHLKGQAGGAVFAAIVVDTFKKIPLLIPGDRVAEDFAQFASRTLSQIDVLTRQNAQLIRARDLLLPRLMDGRIPV